MPGNTKSQGRSGKQSARGKSAVKQYTTQKWNKADSSFHIKLKHVLGGVSRLSLLAAFEVFFIPAVKWNYRSVLFQQVLCGSIMDIYGYTFRRSCFLSLWRREVIII